jgi:hypothetical protein
LLYIGSAYDPDERCKAHRTKPWWPLVHSRTEEWQPSRGRAYAAELQAIGAEDPQHNAMGTRWWKYPDTEATRRRTQDNKLRGRVQSEGTRLFRVVLAEAEANGVSTSEAWFLARTAEADLLEGSGLFQPSYIARLREFAR